MLPAHKCLAGNSINVRCHVTSKELMRAHAVGEKRLGHITQIFLISFRSTRGEHPVKRRLLTTKLHGLTIDSFLNNA